MGKKEEAEKLAEEWRKKGTPSSLAFRRRLIWLGVVRLPEFKEDDLEKYMPKEEEQDELLKAVRVHRVFFFLFFGILPIFFLFRSDFRPAAERARSRLGLQSRRANEEAGSSEGPARALLGLRKELRHTFAFTRTFTCP
jgi:hypothetical protein